MGNNRAALRYAKAVFSLSQEQKNADEIYENMQLIETTIQGSKELQLVLSNTIIKSDEKKNVLLAVFDNKINVISKNLIDLLITNKRLSEIDTVAKQFIALYDSSNGKETAVVTTATPLTKTTEKLVLAKVKELTGKEAILENKVDPAIIGGFILRIGDIQYDASFENKLKVIKRQLN